MKALHFRDKFFVGSRWYGVTVIVNNDGNLEIKIDDNRGVLHLDCDDLKEIQKFAKKDLCNS